MSLTLANIKAAKKKSHAAAAGYEYEAGSLWPNNYRKAINPSAGSQIF